MGKTKKKTYQLTREQKLCAERELELILFALSIDHQWGVREICYLLECLALPRRLKRREQLEGVERELALYREKVGFGRVWTRHQLDRAFYSQANGVGFRRPSPQPMTEEEAKAFGPSKLPKLDVRHVLRHRVQVDPAE